MLYAYGGVCFLAGLAMALGNGRGMIFNILASVFSFVAIGLRLYGVSDGVTVFAYIHIFILVVVIFINGVIAGTKMKMGD